MARTAKKETALTLEEKLMQALVPEAEQPYQVPENWCWVRWGAVGDFIAGNGFKNEYQGFTEYEIPFYKVGSLKNTDSNGFISDNSNTINEDIRCELKATLIPPYSILFAKIGEAIRLNRRSINAISCCIDNNMMAFYPKCLMRYAYYWSSSVDLYEYTNATTVPAIRKSDLEVIPFPLAPLAEQQRIVDRIERLFAKLDEAKEKAQEVVDGYDARRAAILHKAFTGELTSKWRSVRGVKKDSWLNTNLSHSVLSFKYGTSEKSTYENTGMPVFRIPNVTDLGLSFEDLKYLPHDDIPYENQIHENEVLIIRSNGSRDLVGKSVLVPHLDRQYAYASFLIKAVPAKMIDPAFLVYYLNSADARNQMFRKAKSTAGINNINSKELGELTISVPPLQEQAEIVSILGKLLEGEMQAVETAKNAVEKIEQMKKSILSRTFRGELGTNNATDESAEELLKRVL